MYLKIYFLILCFLLPFMLNARNIIDSVFHHADFVVAGEITEIKGSFREDLGTEVFHVLLKIDIIYKQNTHLNIPVQTITWAVSYLRYTGPILQNYINQYIGKKYIFLLNQGHIRGENLELDSLQIIPLNTENHLRAIQLANEEKISICLYNTKHTCNNNCFFCRAAYNENWAFVMRIIDSNDNNPNFKIEKHRCVKYVLPIGEVLSSLPTWGTKYVCFRTKQEQQVKALTYQIGYYKNIICFFHFENVNYYDLKRFENGEEFELRKLEAYRTGLIWEASYDTASYPDTIPLCLPDLEYIRLWNIFEYHTYFHDNGRFIQKFSKEYVDSLEKNHMIYNLCLLSLHRSVEVKIWAVQALARLNDPRAIPYLIYLAEFYKNIYLGESDLENVYQLYLREIVSALDSMTGCSTIIPYGADHEQFRLNMGIPIWKTKFVIRDLQ